MGTDDLEVHDVPDAGRYELRRDGTVLGYASYRRQGDRILVPHVEVDRAVEGRGFGGRLVQGVLDDVRRQGLSVAPLCPFAAAWIRRHPEYQGLVP